MSRIAVPIALLLLAGCARSEEASLVPPQGEGGYNAVDPVRTPERDDAEVAIGEWRQSVQEEDRVLEFGPIGAQALFSLRCDERRGVLLQRHGAVPTGELPMMLVTVGSETRRLAVTTEGGTIPMMTAAIPPSDPLMDQLRQSTSDITIRIGDSVPLILAADPMIGEFVESCATPEGQNNAGGGGGREAGGEEAAAQPSG